MPQPVVKRPYESERMANNNKVQRVNFLENQPEDPIAYESDSQQQWESWSENADLDIDENVCDGIVDQINFLGEGPSCHQ